MCVDFYDTLQFYSGFECLHFVGCCEAKFGEFLAKFRKGATFQFARKVVHKFGSLTLKMDVTCFYGNS